MGGVSKENFVPYRMDEADVLGVRDWAVIGQA